MWQAIRDNTRRSRQVIVLMAVILVSVGALLGRVLVGEGGSGWGVVGAVAIWCALMAITFLGGERFVLFAAGAREVGREEAPRLWNVVEEMTIASGLGDMPRIWVLDSYMQNAFAIGRTPATASIVVTEGLIRRLSRDELQGVIAHEVGHIRNQDVRFMTVASVMLGSITLLADTCRRVLWFGGGRRSRLNGPVHVYLILMALVLAAAILAPLCARLLYLVCSREREFLADASAARFTRYPEGLASALEKIAQRRGVTREDALRTLAPMYIVNPIRSVAFTSRWFETHPPTAERVRILRAMAGSGWVDYERAYQQVRGAEQRCLDPSVLALEGSIPSRAPGPAAADDQSIVEREVADLLDRVAALLPVSCACGLRIKVPGRYPRNTIECPRCGSRHGVPQPEPTVEGEPGGELTFIRREAGWDGFRCSCGRVNQLSPGLRVSSVRCKGCRRAIRILLKTA